MNVHFAPAKLLICVVGRHRGEKLVDLTKSAGARGGTIALARSTDGNPVLQFLSLTDTALDMVFTLMRDETEAVLAAVKSACVHDPKKLGGTGMLLDVSGMLVRSPLCNQNSNASGPDARSERMESGYTLITVIVNHGFADDVMAKARKAGARGGTILTGRGTGTEEDVKFFGISLVPEKEMLFIVAANDKVDAIHDAINSIPHLCEPGGGISFTMNVEQFIRLGQDGVDCAPPA
ncbi:P-II family nitrogen regulator [Desulfovibrio sp. OttesenSCG-928-I05]|nr:P-II family nitrogen regulator [Desulfovibrio sp. OttesenSCG-928-I05]